MSSSLSIFNWANIAVITAFILNVLVYWRNWRKLQHFTKPLAMITIILWTLSLLDWQFDYPVFWLVFAQVFCLAGDIFLLFSDGWFMAGLAAFLVGHLFYLGLMASVLISGLNSGVIVSLSLWVLIVGAIGLVMAMMIFFRVFKPAFREKDSGGKLWFAVQIYAFILSSMMIAAFMLVFALPNFNGRYIFVPIGGALFFASDFMLAYDRFVKENMLLKLLVWITYHLAQICLAWGFITLIG
ncbi:MAG: lysoplasmalogenase [Anaerolineales bacterium]